MLIFVLCFQGFAVLKLVFFCGVGGGSHSLTAIDVRSPYVTPELNNELQCNVGNM